ncbi:hypothetical protein Cgig2_029107 [Carnegiea gigantea]|uniref:Reverse transcriptase zinc-binding domain-containing protein n=1 Tax=Carnegiea gigantea TaxID=171969 RepID=A0A9Q1GLF9_9CARY|nr:hypothetical protein Cgig2_029107 [Carnegiea gigantea]
MTTPDFSSPEKNKESWPPTFSPFGTPLEPLLKVLTRSTSWGKHPYKDIPSTQVLYRKARNYLWGRTEEHTKVPHISWANTCKAKKHGRTGIKDYVAWNKVTIAKLVWAVATKKDTLWVKWVHGRYIKDTNCWDYALAPDSSWTWKKICSTKETFKPGYHNSHDWQFQGRNLVECTKVSRDKVVWARASIPRHAFITWVYVQHRLPTKARLNRFIPQSDLQCLLCNNVVEEDTHLFTECPYAVEVWDSLMQWWPIPCRNTYADLTASLSRYRAPKAQKQISCAIFAAAIYFIWYARNQLLFKNHRVPAQQTVNMIKEQIRHPSVCVQKSLLPEEELDKEREKHGWKMQCLNISTNIGLDGFDSSAILADATSSIADIIGKTPVLGRNRKEEGV